MLKFSNFSVTFAEYPDEISLYITLTNCPIKCEGCNSKHLWGDTGYELNWSVLYAFICANKGITAVVFGGGDNSPKEVDKLAKKLKEKTKLKVCWYSGLDRIAKDIDIANFDAIKIGHFNGIPLNKEGTNQIFYEIEHLSNGQFELVNSTYKFQKL